MRNCSLLCVKLYMLEVMTLNCPGLVAMPYEFGGVLTSKNGLPAVRCKRSGLHHTCRPRPSSLDNFNKDDASWKALDSLSDVVKVNMLTPKTVFAPCKRNFILRAYLVYRAGCSQSVVYGSVLAHTCPFLLSGCV